VHHPALYPETLEYDAQHQRFLVSSLREGGVFALDRAGNAALLVDDARLCSVLGIAVDAAHGRLWAVNADLGASVRPSQAGVKALAAVGVYDLVTGSSIHYVDVAALADAPHLLNGIAVDAAGNAYATDSFAPVIYEIDAAGRPSVFLRSERFAGQGINLNGVVVHPDGYLLVVKKSEGVLFKVPLGEPARFSEVAIPERFVGGDGLTLVGKTGLVVVANRTPTAASDAAYALTSDDGWATAKLVATEPLGDVYPTTAAVRDGTLYVLSSRLNELIRAPRERQSELRVEASIRPIGRVAE
jgi:hypothetical protein